MRKDAATTKITGCISQKRSCLVRRWQHVHHAVDHLILDYCNTLTFDSNRILVPLLLTIHDTRKARNPTVKGATADWPDRKACQIHLPPPFSSLKHLDRASFSSHERPHATLRMVPSEVTPWRKHKRRVTQITQFLP
jgi:hypothetical protein